MNPPKPETPVPVMLPLDQMVQVMKDNAAALYEARESGIPRGPQTGFPVLDARLGGCLMQGLYIIDGQPGTGKTALALQIAASCGCPALFVTCEMSPLELSRRNAARVTRVGLTQFKTGEMPPEAAEAHAIRSARETPQLVLIDSTRAPAMPAYLRECLEIVKTQHEARHGLIVIDSLHSWVRGFAAGVSEYEALGDGISALLALARETDTPIVCISERNRESMKTGGVNAGAGNRFIEYAAEAVMGMEMVGGGGDTPKPDRYGNLPIRLKVNKNRHEAGGTKVNLLFNGKFQKFTEDINDEEY